MLYRIVEKDKFYIQRKFKFIGWHYIYKLEDSYPFPIISTFLLSLVGITVSIFFFRIYTILPTLLFIFLFLLARLWYPKTEDTLEQAKNYIKDRLKQREKRREKRTIKKIHYMDIQTERKEKLGNLNA